MARLPGAHALDHQVLQPDGDDWVLAVSRCPSCGDVRFPPRELCACCLTPCVTVAASHEGVVYEAVRVDVGPVGFETPYWVAYVDLPEGARIFAPLRQGERPVAHGDRVRWHVEVVRTEPYEVLGPIFEPVD